MSIPTKAGNAALRDGSLMASLQKYLADLKPEAVFFCIEGGRRTVYFVIEVVNSHDWPGIVEPLWLSANAEIEVIPAMNADEFAAAQPGIEKTLSNFA